MCGFVEAMKALRTTQDISLDLGLVSREVGIGPGTNIFVKAIPGEFWL